MKAHTLSKLIGIAICLALFTVHNSSSQIIVIDVAGDITENDTWDEDTVRITGDVRIVDNITLTIDPGTYVKFQGNYQMNVKGTLIAVGAPGDSIIFSINDTTGWSTFENPTGGWGGILFADTSGVMADNDTSRLEYCKITHTKALYSHNQNMGGSILCYLFNKLKISNSYFSFGYSESRGGAVYIRESDIVLSDNYFTQNFCRSSGGGVYLHYCSALLTGNDFIKNKANHTGGAILSANSQPVIKDCKFSYNVSGNGGAALDMSGGDSATVINNIFHDNTAESDRGAISLHIDNCLFRNNEIYDNSGGGMYISNSEGTVIDSNDFHSNASDNSGSAISVSYGRKTLVISNNSIYNHLKTPINLYYGSLTIEHNEIFDNSSNTTGGAISSGGGSPTIQFNRIYRNHSNQTGGAIHISSHNGIIRDNLISQNSAGISGGGIYAWISDCRLIQNIIVNNEAPEGGAVHIDEDSYPRIINNTICMNRATNTSSGGALIIGSNSIPYLYNNIIYDNISGAGNNQILFETINPDFVIYNNNIQGGQSAFIQPPGSQFLGEYIDNTDTQPLLKDPSTTAGTAGDGLTADWRLDMGSPCINLGTSNTIEEYLPQVDFFGSKRIRYSYVDLGVHEYQDTVMSFCGTISSYTIWAADTVKVCGNISIQDGVTLTILPGVYVEFQDYYGMTVNGRLMSVGTKKDTIVFSAKDTTGWQSWSQGAGWDGITIESLPVNDSSKLAYCRFELSNRETAGGVVNVINTPKLKITDCLFFHNESSNGSALHLDNSPITIQNCVFLKNSTPIYGNTGGSGAVYLRSSNAILDHCDFIDNTGTRGGAIQVILGNPTIQNCIFNGNWARDFGGAIYMWTKTNAVISQNIFINNRGYDKTTGHYKDGGALYLTGNPIVSENFISNNTAHLGGGIYALNLTRGSVFSNNIISNNRANLQAGGIEFDNDDLDPILLINNTITNNFGRQKAGGIYCAGAHLDIYNTIIWGNKSETGFDQIYFRHYTGDSLKIYNSNIQGGLDEIGYSPAQVYENNLDSLPLFSNPTQDADTGHQSVVEDWYPTSVSPSVNSGMQDPAGLPVGDKDILGSNRINYGRIDMGAIENQADLPSILLQPGGQIKCENESVTFEIQADDSVYYQWTQNTIEIPGANMAKLVIDSLQVSDQGSYQCILSNSYGNVYSNPALLQVKENPLIVQEPESTWTNENESLILETLARGSDVNYQWQKDGIDIPYQTAKLTIEYPDADDEGRYKCIIGNSCSTIETDEADVYLAPQICMVTVSRATGNNLIVWEKYSTAPVDYYNIYRESKYAGIYDLLASIPYDDLSVFVDTTADPTIQAYFYKITATDTSGYETDLELCNRHKTIHLLATTNPETNATQLDWDQYVGFEYGTYEIYRSDTTFNFSSIHEMSSSSSTWADSDPGSDTKFYRIAAVKPEACTASGNTKAGAGPYRHSLSNLDDNKLRGTAVADIESSGDLRIYPNPVTDRATIQFPNPDHQEYRLILTDLSGKVMTLIEEITVDRVEFKRDGLSKGLYLIEIRGPEIYRGKIIIE